MIFAVLLQMNNAVDAARRLAESGVHSLGHQRSQATCRRHRRRFVCGVACFFRSGTDLISFLLLLFFYFLLGW